MLKYLGADVTFSEIPDEVTLCIWISGCPNKCEGCHSPWLREDIGRWLFNNELKTLIFNNEGITCVCFMGGDQNPNDILNLARYVKVVYPKLKVAWYSGKEKIPSCISLNLHNFDYIKIGPYDKDKGPLTSRTTNQRFYEVQMTGDGDSMYDLVDKTDKFWKDDKEDN